MGLACRVQMPLWGFGRPAMMEIQNLQTVSLSAEGVPIRKTVKYEIEDYADPQPNINPKNGYIFTPPAQTPTHPPRP
ncbi:unnamed protein product [Sphenostylis stenocarpa]|uniref:Uncharacterized protein n=1 Tax=Sphenostylis stenocarpa TaxID=92480 RepID=A0AA86RN74_9FABA|nr:unnamed protein product [Sphenostylis stenocarpa]